MVLVLVVGGWSRDLIRSKCLFIGLVAYHGRWYTPQYSIVILKCDTSGINLNQYRSMFL